MSHNDRADPPPPPTDEWVELASPTPAKHGRTFVTVDARYTQLKVETHRGKPVVKSVRVVFADGKQRVVKLQRKRANVIDLGGVREIDHVIVESDPRTRGLYTVHAMLQPTGVAKR